MTKSLAAIYDEAIGCAQQGDPAQAVRRLLSLVDDQPDDYYVHEALLAYSLRWRGRGRPKARLLSAATPLAQQARQAIDAGDWLAAIGPAAEAVTYCPTSPDILSLAAWSLIVGQRQRQQKTPANARRVVAPSPDADAVASIYLRQALDLSPGCLSACLAGAEVCGRRGDSLGERCLLLRASPVAAPAAALDPAGGNWRLRQVVFHRDSRGKLARRLAGQEAAGRVELQTHLSAAAYRLDDILRWVRLRGHRWKMPRVNLSAWCAAGPQTIDLSAWCYYPFHHWYDRVWSPAALQRDLAAFTAAARNESIPPRLRPG